MKKKLTAHCLFLFVILSLCKTTLSMKPGSLPANMSVQQNEQLRLTLIAAKAELERITILRQQQEAELEKITELRRRYEQAPEPKFTVVWQSKPKEPEYQSCWDCE